MSGLAVALGGAVGALARWGAVTALGERAAPWSTLAVNVLGSLLLGVLVGLSEGRLAEPLRLGLAVGVLGAFTTFSTFSVQTLALLREGALVRGLAYCAGSVVLGLLAAVAGDAVGRAA